MSPVIVPEGPQRQAADPASSVWVSANAGSGKTRVLTDRVIRILLRQVNPQPGRILCLTFTKTAAAEMKDRLFERLGAWALLALPELKEEIKALTGSAPGEDLMIRARRLFALALETPGGLKVQTIHAFCESVLRRFPMEAGIPPEFQVLDEQTASALFTGAVDDAIAQIKDSDELRQALDVVAARAGTDALTGLVHATARAVQANDFTTNSVKLRQVFGLSPGESMESLDDDLRDGMDKPALHRAAKALAQGTVPERRDRAPVLTGFLSGQDRLATVELYCGLFLTKENKIRDGVTTKASQAADPDCEITMRTEQARVFELRQKELGLALIEDMEALVLFSGVVGEAYHDAKRKRGFLDYDDLIRLTADLVSRREMTPWVLYKLDGGLDHILVDESQDTSPDQWRVITALSGEFFAGEGISDDSRTIFAVGDEKQSIYSFQDADPKAVAEARRWFAEKTAGASLRWDEPRLETSFRSTPPVLEFVDEVFAASSARGGLQEDPDRLVRHRANRRNRHGRVELWPPVPSDETPEIDDAWRAPLDLPDEQSGTVKLARKIAATIGGWLTEKRTIPSRNRPICPDDILILMRSRNDLFFALARELKRADIPLAGVDRMVLADEIAVMDLMALARFSLLPEDDLTLATILKSPLISLSEEALFDLAYDRNGQSLWRRLRDNAGQLDYSEAHEFLAEMLNLADQMPPFSYFMHVLERRGGRRKFLAQMGAEANDPLDEFLTQVLSYERKFAPSLQGFLAWMEKGATEIKREQDRTHAGVRLMTVHGAKGLEANIVILPDTCTKPNRKHVPKLIPMIGSAGDVVIWPRSSKENPELVSGAIDIELDRTMEEHRRLLYVAMTRARDWLIICGALNKKQQVPDVGSWYALVEPAMEKLGGPSENGLIFEKGGSKTDPEVAGSRGQSVVDLPAYFHTPPSPEVRPSRPLAPSALGGDEPGPGRAGAIDRSLALRRGSLVHRLLEFLPGIAVENREQSGKALIRKYGRDLPEDQRESALGEVLQLLVHPEFALLFAPGSQAEVSVAGLVRALGPYAISGQIDRLAVTGGEVIIADYKSNRLPPQSLEDVPEAYLRQMAAYRAALAEIYPGHAIRAVLVWTAAPSLIKIPQEMLLQIESTLKERTLS